MNANESFQHFGYAILHSLVNRPRLASLHDHALRAAKSGRLQIGDNQVPGTPAAYGDKIMDELLESLLPRLEAETSLKLYPTYSYFRVYKSGDVLKKHTDRSSCEISVTMTLGYEAKEPWPIWIESCGEPVSISLQPGDGLLYKGIKLPHWRNAFHGTYAAQVFLHYVDKYGPYRDWKYDKRATLGNPKRGSLVRLF
jgi:hypothetical protein